VVINHHLPEPALNLVVNLAVPYESDLAKTEAILLDEVRSFAKDHPGCVINDDLPCIRFGEFGESGITCSVVVRITAIEQQGIVKHELIKALHVRLGHEKISIPYPTRTVYHIDAD
jgi:small-conductance mechanosensitive channel